MLIIVIKSLQSSITTMINKMKKFGFFDNLAIENTARPDFKKMDDS